MIVSELKPMEEILGYLDGEKKILSSDAAGVLRPAKPGTPARWPR